MSDLIDRQALCDALDKIFANRIKSVGFDSYETADRDTQLVCDGIMKAIDVVLDQPTVDHLAEVGKKGDMISRADAIDALAEYVHNVDKVMGIGRLSWDDCKDSATSVLEDVPSAQPEITRCKDCKHQIKEWREDKRLKENGYWVYACKVISDICGYWAWFGQDDEFCSEAERRSDG